MYRSHIIINNCKILCWF